jgi:hypothetical protein
VAQQWATVNGGRRLNRAARGCVTSATEMPPWYGAPRLARVRGQRGTDRRTVRRTPAVVRRGRRATRGAGENQGASGRARLGKTRVDSGGVRPWGARRRGRRGGRCTGAARGEGAHDVAERPALRPTPFQTKLLLARFSPKICTAVHKAMNRKVVDLTILYTFHKGSIVFFPTVFA